jgi:hypothetical protein
MSQLSDFSRRVKEAAAWCAHHLNLAGIRVNPEQCIVWLVDARVERADNGWSTTQASALTPPSIVLSLT